MQVQRVELDHDELVGAGLLNVAVVVHHIADANGGLVVEQAARQLLLSVRVANGVSAEVLGPRATGAGRDQVARVAETLDLAAGLVLAGAQLAVGGVVGFGEVAGGEGLVVRVCDLFFDLVEDFAVEFVLVGLVQEDQDFLVLHGGVHRREILLEPFDELSFHL